MTRQFFSTIGLATLSLMLSACRVVLVVPEGGEVHLADQYALSNPHMVCDANQECTRTISTLGIVGPYIAVPHAGWKFAGWSEEHGHTCGPGRGSPADRPRWCSFDFSSLAGDPVGEAIVADDSVFVTISPLFVPDDVGIPITDTVTVAGKEWAQPADFVGFSWDGIQTICPGGSCGPGAILNGFDMAGWTLATVEDANALANHYLAGEYIMGPGPDQYLDAHSAMSQMIPFSAFLGGQLIVFADGPFTPTPDYTSYNQVVGAQLDGLLATTNGAVSTSAQLGKFTTGFSLFNGAFGGMSTTLASPKDRNSVAVGAFFYRLP